MSAGSPWVWARPFVADARVSGVGHQLANLLAPIGVAAEILPGDSPELRMLRRSADRIRAVLGRTRTVTAPGAPALVSWDMAALARELDLGWQGPRDERARLVEVDSGRLAQRVVAELRANDQSALELSLAELTPPGQGGPQTLLVIRSTATCAPLTAEELTDLAVPLRSQRLGVGLAIVACEARLHGGWVRGRTDTAVLEVLLPTRQAV